MANFSNLINKRVAKPLDMSNLVNKGCQFHDLVYEHEDLHIKPTSICPITYAPFVDHVVKMFHINEDFVISENDGLVLPAGHYKGISISPQVFSDSAGYMFQPNRYFITVLDIPLRGVGKDGRVSFIDMIIFDNFNEGKPVKMDKPTKGRSPEENYISGNFKAVKKDDKDNIIAEKKIHCVTHRIGYLACNDIDSRAIKGEDGDSRSGLVGRHFNDMPKDCRLANITLGTAKQNRQDSKDILKLFLDSDLVIGDKMYSFTVRDMINDIYADEYDYSIIKAKEKELYMYVKSYGFDFDKIMDFPQYKEYIDKQAAIEI